MRTEPSTIIGAVSAAIAAILTLLVAFGIDLSDGQQTAILGVVATVGPIVVGIVTRGRVWSPDSHERDKQAALDEQSRGDRP